MGCVKASVEPVRKHLNDGEVLADRKLPELPVILVQDDSMSLSEAKSQRHQFLAARYHADLVESPAAAPAEVVSIYLLTGDPDAEADW